MSTRILVEVRSPDPKKVLEKHSLHHLQGHRVVIPESRGKDISLTASFESTGLSVAGICLHKALASSFDRVNRVQLRSQLNRLDMILSCNRCVKLTHALSVISVTGYEVRTCAEGRKILDGKINLLRLYARCCTCCP